MELIKKIYIYLFSAVGLVLIVIGAVELINLGLRTYVFIRADMTYEYPISPKLAPSTDTTLTDTHLLDQERVAQTEYQNNVLVSTRQRQAANAIALLIVGIPLFAYHWKTIRKEK